MTIEELQHEIALKVAHMPPEIQAEIFHAAVLGWKAGYMQHNSDVQLAANSLYGAVRKAEG